MRNGLRKASGQGLVESTAGLCIILPIGMFMICGFVNVFAMMLNGSKLNFIAMEAVKYRQEHVYWLGMRRQDDGSLKDRADQTAAKMAVQMAKSMGIGLSIENVKFNEREVPAAEGELPITMEECSLTPNGINLPFAGIPGFKSFFNPSVKVAVAEAPVPPPCAFILDVNYQPGKGDLEQTNNPMGSNTGILVPAYGASWGPTNKPPGGIATSIPDMPKVPREREIQGLPRDAIMGVMSPQCYMRSPAGIAASIAAAGQ